MDSNNESNKLNLIEMLRQDVKDLCDYNVAHINVAHASTYDLSSSSPARVRKVGDKWNIYILDTLSKEESIEAEAHELGHLLVYYKPPGIASLDTVAFDNELLGGLIGRLENAITHKLLIDILKEKYRIGSQLHILLQTQSLNELPESIKELEESNCKEFLYAMGVYLFDISQTADSSYLKTIEGLVSTNETLKLAYHGAVSYLSNIEIGQPLSLQYKHINDFMESIGYKVEEDYYFI